MVNTDPQTKAPPMGTSFEDFQAQAESQDIDISWTVKRTLDGEVYTLVNISGEVGCFFFIDGQGRVSEEHFQMWFELQALRRRLAKAQDEERGWSVKEELGSLSEARSALLKEHGSDEYIFIDHLGAACGDEFVSDPEKKSVYLIPWANEATADEFFLNIGIKSNFSKGEDLTLTIDEKEAVLTPRDACQIIKVNPRLGYTSSDDLRSKDNFFVGLFEYLRAIKGFDLELSDWKRLSATTDSEDATSEKIQAELTPLMVEVDDNNDITRFLVEEMTKSIEVNEDGVTIRVIDDEFNSGVMFGHLCDSRTTFGVADARWLEQRKADWEIHLKGLIASSEKEPIPDHIYECYTDAYWRFTLAGLVMSRVGTCDLYPPTTHSLKLPPL
tara:strand:+ start:6097 stop:7251 length:1155 start_codon:yes stop_codon:yes gene_type:complete